jgi:hypothetical protein
MKIILLVVNSIFSSNVYMPFLPLEIDHLGMDRRLIGFKVEGVVDHKVPIKKIIVELEFHVSYRDPRDSSLKFFN